MDIRPIGGIFRKVCQDAASSATGKVIPMQQVGPSFRQLHEGPGAFIIPNPWDVGTARILAALGFRALATTSAGMSLSLGIAEGQAPREQVLVIAVPWWRQRRCR
jgi:hypothetical protein